MSGGGGSVYIQVADNDVSGSRTKLLQHRRKRRRFEFPRKHRPPLRILVRCWPALLLLLVVALFIFDSSVILGVSVSSELQKPEPQRAVPLKEVPGNLNRLDPTTRMVNGTRQPCLKLLPPEELQILDLPPARHSSSPVVRLMYRTRINGPPTVDNSTLLQNNVEAKRLNLFTGYQTLAEREQSFKVNESVVVHCGFYSENGGFKISDEDKNYLQSCNVVVSTCTFGGGDDLYQPVGMSEASIRKVCYVAFWDEITLRTQESEGHIVDEGHMIGRWRIVIVKDLPFVDQRLNGKVPKMLGHRLFPQARFSIWVDSKSQFRRDPVGVLEALLWRTNSVLAISEHGARSSIYDEGKAVVKKNKATPEEVEAQLSQYRQDGFPDDKRFRGKKALSEASVIVREHTPLTNLLMCLWFNEVVRFTSRDQLSFPFVFRKLKALKNVNMFPVCTRKDLVNSMGHRRKAKPLSTA